MENPNKPTVPAWGWIWYLLSFFMLFIFGNSVQSLVTSDGFVTPGQMEEYQTVLASSEIKYYPPTTTTSLSHGGISKNMGSGKSDNTTTSRTIGQGMHRLELKLEGQPAIANTKYNPGKEKTWEEFVAEVRPGDAIVLKLFKSSLEKAKSDANKELVIYGVRTEAKTFISYTNVALFFEFWMWEILMIVMSIASGKFLWSWWGKARIWSANKKRGLYAGQFEVTGE